MKNNYMKNQLNESTFLRAGVLVSLMIAGLIAASVHYAKGQIDINEYPPGHPNVTVSAVEQLKAFPVPRYKQGHTLLPNYPWIDPIYFGGRFQPGISDAQAVTNSVDIQTELAKNFNYYIHLSWSSDNFNTAWKNLANANTQWPIGLLTFRAQTGTKIWNQSLPGSNYLQNSSGQFLDVNGNVTTNKIWRPTAPTSSYTQDGLNARGYIQSALSGLTRNVDLVNEDGEVFWLYSTNALSADPQVAAAKSASGLDWETFHASKVKENDQQAYRDQFMSLPQLQNAKYTQYRMDGQREWNFRWEQQRYVSSLIKGQYYSTSDFYVRWPNNWKDWNGPWHGLKWMTESRHYEIAAGDRLYSPFVSAGWDANPENDVRPAQWLGLLKLVGMYGAEFYYTCYFNEQGNYNPPNPPPYNPRGYAWQAAMPPYSQAITSRYEDILRNGSLLPGDMIDVSHNPDIPYYQFSTGASNKVVSIRKSDTANKYAITGTIQNSSNVINSTPLSADVSITLNSQSLQFKIRRQGSTFIYDNTVPSAPVFYQLDEWHEATHPYYWSKDFSLEAELYDNATQTYKIKTTVPAGTASGDFRNATSFITYDDATTVFTPIEYVFQPRDAANSTYYVWVKARSRVNGVTTGLTVSVDNANQKTIGCISDTIWTWYRLDACSQQVIQYNSLSLANHILRLTPSNSKLEIDKIFLTRNSSTVMTPTGVACSGTTVTVTANGPLTFCQGGSVTLTASSGSSYQWSTGATSQAITVTTSGSYVVSVTGTGCTGVSAPQTVTVVTPPTANITASGSLTFCQGGSVVLTSSAGSSYLWTPGGATTQTLNVTNAGSYTVRVTNSSGCSATSGPSTVTVNSNPVATITANGSTTFCQGGNVTLTSSSGSSYLWTPGNQTTQAISVSSTGNYSVRVTNSSGCSATSSPQTVTVNIPAVPVITPNGSLNIYTGQTVTLTSSAGASYLWTPGGQTTQSITTGTAGNYRVTVTYSNGCSAISPVTTVTVTNPTPVTISVNGSTTICEGDSVMLTATSGFTYLWFPGLQTTQSIYVTENGNYSVQASNGTSAQTTITVNEKPLPPSISISYIPNSAYQLTAYEPSAVSYLWSNGMTSQTINITSAQTVWVKAISAFGCIGDMKSITSTAPVSQPCAKANMLTSFDIINVSATVAWNPAITADSFMVSYIPQGGNSITKVVPGNISSTKLTGLIAGTNYSWSVKTFCTSGTQTSSVSSFTTLGGPLSCGSTPVNLSTTNINYYSAKLNWYPTSAQQLKIRYRKTGTTTYSYRTLNALTNPDFASIGNLIPLTTYEWSILSICNGNSSLYSSKATFTTAGFCADPGTPGLQEINYDFVIINWNPSIVADSFKIRYAVEGTTDFKYKSIDGNPNTGWVKFYGVIADTDYFLQMRSVCSDGGKSLWSDTLFFHTTALPQPRPAASGQPLQLNAYPNPVKDKISYAFVAEKESEYVVKVTDMSGRELIKHYGHARVGVNGDDLNLTGYTSGIYMLVLEQGPVSGRFKFSIH